MRAGDLDSADRVMRLAFGTIRGLPDPSAAFGDSDSVRTRFRAAPESAWAAELDGEVMGSVFASRWGSFGFIGPFSVHPSLWDQGIGGRLLQPVLEAFERWDLQQAGLFTFAASPSISASTEVRLLARISDRRDEQGDRCTGAEPVYARFE